MKLIDYKCPHCGGELHIAEGRKEAFCEFCGSKLILDDENRTLTTVTIVRDEAKIKELEMIQDAKAKREAEIIRKEERLRWGKIDAISILIIVATFVLLYVGKSFNWQYEIDDKTTLLGYITTIMSYATMISITVLMVRILRRLMRVF